MGDKGGRKDKEKGRRQEARKQKARSKEKEAKKPKSRDLTDDPRIGRR